MEQKEATTVGGEAQSSCALKRSNSLHGIGVIEHQPQFAPVTRRALLAAVNNAGRALGLRSSSVVVLDALLSCLPCSDPRTGDDRPITPLTLLTVFACNDTLCFRAKGISDRQLRRHLDKLEAANLILRRDSANGKRFPIMRKGQVVGAFGIDLSPLLARSGEILELAQQQRREAEELRGMKACIQRLRLECLSLDLQGEALDFVEAARNIMRRTGVTVLQAKNIIARLQSILRDDEAAGTDVPMEKLAMANSAESRPCSDGTPTPSSSKMTASDGQDVRHKETPKSYTHTTLPHSVEELWARLSQIPAFYPNQPTTEHELLQLLFEFGKMLRIDNALLGRVVSVLGLTHAIALADQMASRIDLIHSPNGYLSRILASSRQKVGHGQLCLRA